MDEGFWLRAECQTAGRGRQGKPWVSPAGNLYASTLVRPRPTDPPAATLAFVAAVALEAVIAPLLPAARLKWPNDLLLGGAKLSGILLERTEEGVVIGVGLNLAHHPDLPERPTTSLAAHDRLIGPEPFAEMLAESFARWLARWRHDGFASVRARWLERAHPAGTALSAHLPDGDRVEGVFEDLDRDGALILRLASGQRRAIHAGDVFLV